MLRLHPERKTFSAEIKNRTFGRIHLSLKTKVKAVAITRHAALQQLLDTGEPVRDVVNALRAEKITIEAVAECVRSKQAFDILRPSQWPTLGDAIASYVEYQREAEGGSASTANSSAIALNYASQFFGDDRLIETITYDETTALKAFIRDSGLTTNTVALYMVKFGALYTFLQKQETRRATQHKRTPATLFSPVDRAQHIPAKVKTRARFLTEAEVEQAFTVTPDWFKAAIALGVFAGLRLGEVEQLRPHMDVDIERNMIYVQARDGWTPKYRKNREVPISSALEPYLVRHLASLPEGAPYLFAGRSKGEPVGRSTMIAMVRTITKACGLYRKNPDPDAVTFHTLRHTFASWLVMEGADLFTVARLMGHANTKQIEDTYAHLSPEHRLATIEMLSVRWGKRATARPTKTTPTAQQTPQETL